MSKVLVPSSSTRSASSFGMASVQEVQTKAFSDQKPGESTPPSSTGRGSALSRVRFYARSSRQLADAPFSQVLLACENGTPHSRCPSATD